MQHKTVNTREEANFARISADIEAKIAKEEAGIGLIRR